jgi:hypothetical protein
MPSPINEVDLLTDMAARVARIDGSAPYQVDIGERVLTQRIDFDAHLDEMPLVGVVIHGGEFVDVGNSPRYADQQTVIELVGCIKNDDEATDPLKLLQDMKTAAFTLLSGDAFDLCVNQLRATEWRAFLARNGELFTQVSLYLVAHWGDHSIQQSPDD